ncbi:T9SS type A sorting domain-containing protein [Puia sp. P3]|uniref:T9SS type A sorting domain-containing protein n=1 Tax=Puia sp. P3 TaxID=3423952 RepID=UPI003D66D7A2
MNPIFVSFVKRHVAAIFILLTLSTHRTMAQACATSQGNQNAYGTNNVWIGYAYKGSAFNYYQGYVNEGSASSPNFDESFGGDQVNYPTNGCSVYTEQFSMRYKLTQSLNGSYTITVGGDDGYRLSLDGGSTRAINNWGDHGYATTSITVSLSGATNLVLEYYENGGGNRVSFNLVFNCAGSGTPTAYGSNNVWQGHLYQGVNFDTYKGDVTEGATNNPTFDESFGTSNGNYYTNSCYVATEQFSARYMLQQNLPYGNYIITVGGDDGYRFSLDGGSTWVINNWADHAYTTSTYTATLSGTKNMVLEYYENGGANRVTFAMSSTLLPVTLTRWTATAATEDQTLLKWAATNAVDFDHYIIQRSTDGQNYQDIRTVPASTIQDYSYTDVFPYNGMVYYRLEMVDIDGRTNYSGVATLLRHSTTPTRIYPTIIENSSVFVETSKTIRQARLEVFDMNGRRLQEKDWPALEGRQQMALTALPAGAYLVRLSDFQTTLAKQIILVR